MTLAKLAGTATSSAKTADLNKVIDAVNALEAQVAVNTQAIRAILTMLHPDPQHSDLEGDPALAPFHHLVMKWIERYGREEPI